MILIFPVGWNNYTPYLAKEIIGNIFRKCSDNTKVIDLNNIFFSELIHNTDYYQDTNFYQFNAVKQLDYLVSKDSIKDFDIFLLAKKEIDEFLSKYKMVDSTMSISLDGVVFTGVTDDIFKIDMNNIFDYVLNQKSIILNRYFSNILVTELLEEEIIAFSVTCSHQLVTAFYLANIIRIYSKKIKILIGGNYLSRVSEKLIADGRIFQFVDYLITGCGEISIPQLYKYLNNQQVLLHEIPNIAYFDNKKNKVVQTCVSNSGYEYVSAFGKENCSAQYFLPQKVVPIYLTRGCAWKKCVFCSIPYASGKFCIRNLKDTVNDIKQYVNNGVNHFNFIDEALTPNLMNRLADEILYESLSIRWGALARFDQTLSLDICKKIYNAGCRRIQFGLESYNRNILSLMNKGVNYDDIKMVITRCIESGLSINLFCMIGFPGETEEEARNTVDFVINLVREALWNYGVLVTVDFSAFLLDVNSNIYFNQGHFKVESEAIESDNLSLYARYTPELFDKDTIVFEAELKYSKIIFDYFVKDSYKLKKPIYINEAYWFLKACDMRNV